VLERPAVDHRVELLLDRERTVEIVDQRGSFEVRRIDRLEVTDSKQVAQELLAVLAEGRRLRGKSTSLGAADVDVLPADRQRLSKDVPRSRADSSSRISGYVRPTRGKPCRSLSVA
jgi:hypothetical protein